MLSPNGYSDQELEEMWCELENVLFDEDENGELILSQDWKQFPKGTNRDENKLDWNGTVNLPQV